MADITSKSVIVEALERAGLLPREWICTRAEIHIGQEEVAFIRFDVTLTPEMIHALGQGFCAATVAERLKQK